tara:strand:+ start:414 stop:581 length:168 start_codon:yes stop_codon:yes gene_type:complete
MDEFVIKIECLRLAQTGSPDVTIRAAQIYYDWVMKSEKPKRGRPPKKDVVSSNHD